MKDICGELFFSLKFIFGQSWNVINNLTKKDVIYIMIIAVLILALLSSFRSCSEVKHKYDSNIIALTDTVAYYKSKNGDIVAEKHILEGDIDNLKLANEDLYNQLKNMKVKNPESVVKIETEIIREKVDTIWEVKDSIFNKQFQFNDKWRILEGNVQLKNKKLSLDIDKDVVYGDYTIAIKNNKAYITSNNPYVVITDINGISLPKQQRDKWSLTVGPSIFGGINPVNGQGQLGVGVSINIGWSILSW